MENKTNQALPRVVYAGPEYTPSYEAAIKLFPESELHCLDTVKEVFKWVEAGKADYGILPAENSGTGPINESYHLLLDQHFEGWAGNIRVRIVDEIYLQDNLNLLARKPIDLKAIKTLYVDPQSQLLCSDFIAGRLGHVEIDMAPSAITAAGKLNDGADVCIGGDLLMSGLGLILLDRAIQDYPRSVTRCIVISAKHEARDCKYKKTTISFVIHNEPGALARALKSIADEGINLASIKLFPVRDSRLLRKAFNDWFVVDVEAPEASRQFKNFFHKHERHSDFIGFKVLGSYPDFERENQPRPVHGGEADALLAMIEQGESRKVEFKETLWVNVKAGGGVDKTMKEVVARAIASFVNSEGGVLFIGVNDKGEAVGLDKDIDKLRKKDEDGFITELYDAVRSLINESACRQIDPVMLSLSGKRICAVKVAEGATPAWVLIKGKDRPERVFYYRSGNSTRTLKDQEVYEYWESRKRAAGR